MDRDTPRGIIQRKNASSDLHEDVRARMVHEVDDSGGTGRVLCKKPPHIR